MTKSNRRVLKSFSATTVIRKKPVNMIDADAPLFEVITKSYVSEIQVVEMRNVCVFYNGTISKGLSVVKNMLLSNDDGEIVPYSKFSLLKISILWPRQRLPAHEPYLLVHNNYSHTYYHWVTEALPRLFLIKDLIAQAVLLLPVNHDQRFHRETLEIFGVGRVHLVKENVRYVVPELTASTQIGRIANYNPSIIREMVGYVKSKITCNTNFGDKLYISRSKAAKRKVINEGEVELYLKDIGFRIVNLEDFGFADQVSMMHHCRYLVGLHGAGLANMIFMKENGAVFELRKNDLGANYFYFALASTVNHKYYYQFCAAVNDKSSVQDTDVLVNIDGFRKTIQEMLS